MKTKKIIKSTLKLSLIAIILSILAPSCKEEETAYEKTQKELEKLQQYLSDSSITVTPKPSGLYYIETLAGTGTKVSAGRYVTVKYEGRFLNGEVFDSSDEDNFTFMVGYGDVIQGWDEGVTYMKSGGKATLIIPSTIGYGPYGSDPIPGYTTLVFDIEIINVL